MWQSCKRLVALVVLSGSMVFASADTMLLSQVPLSENINVPPNILMMISTEYAVASVAFLRSGIPYRSDRAYYGYFSSNHCYEYRSYRFSEASGRYEETERSPYDPSVIDWFVPVRFVGLAGSCGGTAFHGNFMNWSTMTSVDLIRLALTGGSRAIDSYLTVLQRAPIDTDYVRRIVSAPEILIDESDPASLFRGNIADVLPIDVERLTLRNEGNRIIYREGSSSSDAVIAGYEVRVQVCESSISGSYVPVCVPYRAPGFGTVYKPEGLMQEYRDGARFGVLSYFYRYNLSGDYRTDFNPPWGIALRGRMKSIGSSSLTFLDSVTIGSEPNPLVEYDSSTGQMRQDPEGWLSHPDALASDRSGVMNFINHFHFDGRYKAHDPLALLFYEGLRYFRNIDFSENTRRLNGHSLSFYSDRVALYDEWDTDTQDPILSSCQKNYALIVGDNITDYEIFLPGMIARVAIPGAPWTLFSYNEALSDPAFDAFLPSGDPNPNQLDRLMDFIGEHEGVDVTNAGSVCLDRSKLSTCLLNGDFRGVQGSWALPAMAYWARVNDIRPDLEGVQFLETLVVDTWDISSGAPSHGIDNRLWLASKYGSFIDSNGNQVPDLREEWTLDDASSTDPFPRSYLRASNPNSFVTGLRQIFATTLSEIDTGAAGASASALSLNAGDLLFFSEYRGSGIWSGDIVARPLESSVEGYSVGAAVWRASSLLDGVDPSSRVILSYQQAGKTGISFRWSSLSAAQKALLSLDPVLGLSDSFGEQRLDYIRGSRADEGGIFRSRESVLGDIVNSSVVYVQGQGDVSYIGESGYREYIIGIRNRMPVVYVGANDGMLHAFRAQDFDTGLTSLNGGEEIMAYVPDQVIKNLGKLTQADYGHHFYVDGQLTSGDARLGSGSSAEWKTVLVGGLAAGGRGVYALDIYDPLAFSEDRAAQIVLWSFSEEVDPDVGHVYTKPVIGRMRDGSFVAIFGNGYNSTGAVPNQGHVFIVALDGLEDAAAWVEGDNYFKLSTDVGGESTFGGVSGIDVVRDSTGSIVAIYGVDLQGNLWRFDVSSETAADWSLSSNRRRLFQATVFDSTYAILDRSRSAPQPIGNMPVLYPHPMGGKIVIFGTGLFVNRFHGSDLLPNNLYGIWDSEFAQFELGGVTLPSGDTPLVDRDDLYRWQTGAVDYSGGFVTSEAESEDTAFSWVGDDAVQGWTLDLSASTERLLYEPTIREGKLFFTTGRQYLAAGETCNVGLVAYDYEIYPETGAPIPANYDTNSDGLFSTSSDLLNAVGLRRVNGSLSRLSVFQINSGSTLFFGQVGAGGVSSTAVAHPEGRSSDVLLLDNSSAGSAFTSTSAAAVRSASGTLLRGVISWREVLPP